MSPAASPGVASTPGHIPALDGIRGLAILAVMVYHTFIFGGMPFDSAADRAVFAIAGTGWAGVDLFFVLSGFLITGILYDARGSDGYFRVFYARRTLRIFPLYYGALALYFLVLPAAFPSQAAVANTGGQLWFWSYLSNVETAIHGWGATSAYVDHFWSLAVEEQFYLVWPLVIFHLSRRATLRLCAALCVGSLLFRAWLVQHDAGTAAFVLMPARVDALAIGAALALSVRGPQGTRVIVRYAKPVLATCLLLVAGIWILRGGFSKNDPVVAVVGFSLTALVSGGFLGLAITAAPTTRLARSLYAPSLRSLGKYSYALYLFHQPLALVLPALGISAGILPSVAGSSLPGQLLYGTVVIALSFAAALASWHLYEKHFLKLKRFVTYEPRGAPVLCQCEPIRAPARVAPRAA